MVYRAVQEGTDREVALKVIRPDLLAGMSPEQRHEAVKRFKTEARAAARVREPDLLRTLEQSSAWLEDRVVAEGPSPSAHVERAEQLRRLAEGLTQLSEDERTAVEMRYLQDPPYPLPEIARELGRPTAKAVAGLLARGLEKLRGLLREQP